MWRCCLCSINPAAWAPAAEGSTKLDLAKAAAIAAADIMNPTDQVGILAFDAAWDWALPFRQVGKGEWISEKLANRCNPTAAPIFTKRWSKRIAASPPRQAAIKHVIVLSDGLTDKADFQSLVAKMARDGITVSTVSVGSDADVQLMADIAKDGKGRGYVALDPQTIPQIFTTETLLISRDLLIEKPVTPTHRRAERPAQRHCRKIICRRCAATCSPTRSRAPSCSCASTKTRCWSSWRYGLGRVMAFTSDLSGRWGKDWVSWQGFPQWASQVARDTMRKVLETKMRTDFHTDGEAIKVVDRFGCARRQVFESSKAQGQHRRAQSNEPGTTASTKRARALRRKVHRRRRAAFIS